MAYLIGVLSNLQANTAIQVVCALLNTVHFGYSGHVGPDQSVHYIRMSTICGVSSIGIMRGQSSNTVAN